MIAELLNKLEGERVDVVNFYTHKYLSNDILENFDDEGRWQVGTEIFHFDSIESIRFYHTYAIIFIYKN